MSVVVAYVPDDTGFLAVSEGARQAAWRQTDVVVVNVVDASAGFALPTAADEKQLDAIEEYLRGTGTPFAVDQQQQETGTVADAILASATDSSAELIVIGVKRRSAVAKAVLGSTGQRVLLGAECPVLFVHVRD